MITDKVGGDPGSRATGIGDGDGAAAPPPAVRVEEVTRASSIAERRETDVTGSRDDPAGSSQARASAANLRCA